ncbi:MAG: hypothetical protein KDB03_17870 [Planctomycetales bacterium]|nr:hypothetical protein [Planctomycetales bacterium]
MGDNLPTSLLLLPSSQHALQELASAPTPLFWNQQELRSGISQLALTRKLNLWLDRRVDPNQTLDLRIRPGEVSTLEDCLQLVARKSGAELAVIGNTVVFCPINSAAQLEYQANQLFLQLAGSRPELAQPTRFQWPELSTPNDLLQQLAKSQNLEIDGRLPHDLLHAGRWPNPSSLATQLSVLAGGFGMQITLESQVLHLGPATATTEWTTEYPKAAVRHELLPNLADTFQSAKFNPSGNAYVLFGPGAFHRHAVTPMARDTQTTGNSRDSRSRASRGKEQPVWTLKILNIPAETVIESIGDNLGYLVEWAPNCTAGQKKSLVSFEVQEAPVNELLESYAQASQFKVELRGKTIYVSVE